MTTCSNCQCVTTNFYPNSPSKGLAQCVACHENWVRRTGKTKVLHNLHGVKHSYMRGRKRRKATNRYLLDDVNA